MSTQPAKLLIANRGEIALRIIRACRCLGIHSVIAYSEADRQSLPVQLADEAVCIGPGEAAESYLKIPRIIAAAEITGATAIHPGYGFLSENHHFAQICQDCRLTFVGPTPQAIRTLGDKTEARARMQQAGVPVIPGSDGPLDDLVSAWECAERLGYPVMLKAVCGGGGKGMRLVARPQDLENAWFAASQEAKRNFADCRLFLEKAIINPRHVEIQIMADQQGQLVSLGDRDCSLQRHHQKMLEEAPCPVMTEELRRNMSSAALKAAQAIGYTGAGTVEFLLDAQGNFYFLEMNTRIQVEHPVTEMVTGTDLVQEQLKVAFGAPLSWQQQDIRLQGHAIEIRLNAEDPEHNFAPCPGKVNFFLPPGGPGIRVDSHLYSGYQIPPYYDSLLGKLIAWAPTREMARLRAAAAIRETVIDGIKNNAHLAGQLLDSPQMRTADYHTGTIDELLKH